MRLTGELVWRAEENLREAFRVLARYAADGAVLELERVCMVATGVPNAFFNPLFLYRPPDDLDIFLRRARAFYESRGGLPWTLLVPEWEEDEPAISASRLRDAGMSPAGTVPLLARETQRNENWPRFHPQAVIEPVMDGDMLGDFRETLAESFGIPGYVTETLMPEMPPPTMRLFVAYLSGEPVGTVSLFDAAGVAGIYSLGVLPSFRRRGIGTALLRHILDEACWEMGLSDCVAQASRPALPLFSALGFERIARCHRYVEPEHMPPGEGHKRG